MAVTIGIDFGEQFVVAAVVDGPQPRVLENRENSPSAPAIIAVLPPMKAL